MLSKTFFRFTCRRVGESNLWLQRIPGDGNCLFGSLVNQILGIHPAESTFPVQVSQMRASIVEHLRRNFSRYWSFLVPFAEDAIKHGFVDVYDRVWQYLDLLSRDGTWGGEECISVAGELFDVCITVWDERSGQFREYSVDSPTARKVAVYYTGSHYDSVVFRTQTDLQDCAGSVDIPGARRMLKILPFFGNLSVYRSFLHQLRLVSDEKEANELRLVVLKLASFIPISSSGWFANYLA